MHNMTTPTGNEDYTSDDHQAVNLEANGSCPICFQVFDDGEHLRTVLASTPCRHSFCADCIRAYLHTSVNDSKVALPCPENICEESIHPNDVYQIFQDNQPFLQKWERYSLRQVLMRDSETRWCPSEKCTYALLAPSTCAQCPELICQATNCGLHFCYVCRDIWHPGQTCVLIEPDLVGGSSAHERNCPHCKTRIEKSGGCNMMTCDICDGKFCWICGKEIDGWFHFTGEQGCPYYGEHKLTWYEKLGLQCLICLIAVPALPLLAILLGLALIPAVPYQLAKNSNKGNAEDRCSPRRVCMTALFSLITLPVSVVLSAVVMFGVMVIGSVLVCVFLPLSWFVDMRNMDYQHMAHNRHDPRTARTHPPRNVAPPPQNPEVGSAITLTGASIIMERSPTPTTGSGSGSVVEHY